MTDRPRIIERPWGGWFGRRIARELGIDRDTVDRYVHLREADSKLTTNVPIGFFGQGSQKTGPGDK